MGWVRLDDRFPDHPKVELLPDKAFRMHIRGLCYSSEHLTDGLVPRPVARRWGTIKTIGALLASGLWSDEKNGYLIHDYLDYNPSKEQVGSMRAARSNAARTRWSMQDAKQDIGEGVGVGVRGKGFIHPLDRAISEAEDAGHA